MKNWKVFCLSLACALSLCAEEFLQNGDFAQGLDHWAVGASIAAVRTVNGRNYVEIDGGDGTKGSDITQKLPIGQVRGKTLLVRGLFAAQEITGGKENYNAGRIVMTWRNPQGKENNLPGTEHLFHGTMDWREECFTVDVPSDAKEVKVYVGLHTCKGKLYAEGLSIQEYKAPVAAPGVEPLFNGDFTYGFGGWNAPANAVIQKDEWGNYALITSTSPDAQSYLTRPLPIEKMRGKTVLLNYRMMVQGVEKGKNAYNNARVTITYKGADGKEQEPFRCPYERVGSHPWERVLRICNIPEDAQSAMLHVGIHSTTGIMGASDFKLIYPEGYEQRDIIRVDENEALVEYVYDGQHIYDRYGGELAGGQRRHYMEHILLETPKTPFALGEDAKERGFEVFRTSRPVEIDTRWVPSVEDKAADAIRLRVAPNQGTETFFLAVWPTKDLTETALSFAGDLSAEIGFGEQMPLRLGYAARDMLMHFSPKYLKYDQPTSMRKGQAELFSVTVQIPEDAKGILKSVLTVHAAEGEKRIPVELEILPFTLADAKPYLLFYYRHNPQQAPADFALARKYGFTSVILAQCEERPKLVDGKVTVDLEESDGMVKAWQAAGFQGPLIYNPFHDRLLSLLIDLHGVGDGLQSREEYSQKVYFDFKAKDLPPVIGESYKEVVRQILDYAKAHDWPEMVYFAVDEPGSWLGEHNWRTEAAFFEHRLIKEVDPNQKIYCTNYFPKMIRQMKDCLDYTCIPLYFFGNKERYKSMEVEGIIDFYHNLGRPMWGIEWPNMWNGYLRARFSAGFYPAQFGLDGMNAWCGGTPREYEPYEDLYSRPSPKLFATKDAQGRIVPTLHLMGSRDGIIDWRYISTLEEKIAAMPESPKKSQLAQKLKAILAQADTGWLSWYSIEGEPEEALLGCQNTPDLLRDKIIDLLLE